MKREIVFWKDYFLDFFKSLDEDSRSNVMWMLKSLASLPKIPSKFFKQIEGVNGLFELRISCGNYYFILATCYALNDLHQLV